MNRRRGMAIWVATGLAFVASLFVFTYYGFMRNQTQQAQVILQGESAYFLAQSGVAAGIANFLNTKSETALHRALTAGDAMAANGTAPEKLDVEHNAALQTLLAEQEGVLSVELSLAGFRPAYLRSESESGISYNTIEKVGWLKIVSSAAIGPARRRIIAFKGVRVVCTIPYVLGKFTLFEQEPEQPGVNFLDRLRWEKTSMTTGRPAETNRSLPAILFNGAGASSEEKGWIFLGGGARKLNLAWGRTGDGEEFHLLEKPWKVMSDPMAPTPLPADFSLMILEKGFFNGIRADNNLFTLFDFAQPAGDPVTENAGLAHLYGSDADRSPTYVLGEVYRRYLSLRYASRKSDGQYIYLPWAAPANWGPGIEPWSTAPPWDVKHDTFEDSFAAYSYSMSQVVEESYNRSVDYISQTQTEVDLPRTLISPGRLRHRFGVSDFLYRPSLNNGDVLVRSSAGGKLFDGNLHGLATGDFYFPERATYSLPSSSFEAFLSLRNPRIPGVLHFTGGDVIIDRPLKVKNGGVIAVDGKITVLATVGVTDGTRPLVLSSLTSDVVIGTAAPVDAALLALSGKVRGTGAGFNVKGSLAAGTVEWSTLLSGTARSSLSWDPNLDPTVPENAVFGVYLTPARDSYMPGGAN